MHLGLGGFHRAHQAWYTMADPDWGIAAYTFRNTELPRLLGEQDGLYSLLVRDSLLVNGRPADAVEVVPSISRAHAGTEHDQWLADVASPEVAVITLTVTEAAYRASTPGEDTAVTRLVNGLRQRWQTSSAPVAIVPCDNVPNNGDVLRRVLRDTAADTRDQRFSAWLDGQVSIVNTVVDRITPASTEADRDSVAALTGFVDLAPVVTEPFTEWLLAGDFPLGRPAWERNGAEFVEDVGAYQERKLWFLNGAHTLVAYAGLARGHATVREAVHDDSLRELMESWWDTAARHTAVPPESLADYRERLRSRFAAPGVRHRLQQIAQDGSQKIPTRILPVLRAERHDGRLPASAVAALAAWLIHLRSGDPHDPRAGELVPLARSANPARAVLAAIDPELGEDAELAEAVEAELPNLTT